MIWEKKELGRKPSIGLFVSVLYVIYVSDSLLFATTGNYNFFGLASRITPLLFFCVMTAFRTVSISKTELFVLVSICISMFLNGALSNYAFYISQIVWILFGKAYSKYIGIDDFGDTFIKIMRIIAVVSLFGFLFRTVLINISFIPTITNVVGRSFKFLFFTNVPLDSIPGRRNWGPFWEPGAYQYYLNIALLFTVMKKNARWKLDTTLFIVTVLTTLSGASILPIPFILLAYVFNQQRDSESGFVRILVTVFLSALLIVLIRSGLFDEVMNKEMIYEGTVSKSAGYRVGTILANAKTFITYPLFGAPPSIQENARSLMIYSLNGVSSQGNVNTITGYFSYYGVLVGSYITIKLFQFTKMLSLNLISRIFVFVAIVVMTSNENLMQSILLGVLIYIGTGSPSKRNCHHEDCGNISCRDR